MKILVTPHAVDHYRERICLRVGPLQAEREIIAALRAPLFHCLNMGGSLTLWGCLNPVGYPFVAATDLADEEAPFLLVRTVGQRFFWHETRKHWKEHNHGSKRHGRIDRIPVAQALR